MTVLVLPYPDLDFVPLDVLTAAEMNQLMANIQAVADFSNGLATGANIADAAIKSNNIDFATIGEFNFSTDEVDTGGKWIDGKAVYKRTFSGDFTATANVQSLIETGVAVGDIVMVAGMWNNFSANWIQFGAATIGAQLSTSQYSYAYMRDSAIAFVFRADNAGTKPYRVTVWYTKPS